MSEPLDNEVFGLSIPFRIDPGSGGVAVSSGERKLRENLLHILMTSMGTRVMERDYGSGLRQLVQEPNNDALRAIAYHQIAKAVARYEPRVLLQQVHATQEGATLHVQLQYLVRRTRELQDISVAFPLGSI